MASNFAPFMILEHLTVRVPLPLQSAFLAADADIWTAALSDQPGFAGKEVWRDAEDPDHLHLIIRWSRLADWKAVPPATLVATEAAFVARLGRSFPILSCTTHEALA